jgi:signal transduction histidine kinase
MPQTALPRLSSAPPLFAVPDEARPFLQALLDAPGWALGFLDREARLQWANDTLAALSGQPHSALAGRTLAELWPTLAPALSSLCARAMAGEQVNAEPLSGTCGAAGSGTVRHLRVSVIPAVSGGLLAGLTVMIQDDTERVTELQRAREAEARATSLVDLSCDGYLVHDGTVVLEVSRSGASLLEYTPREMVGQPLKRFLGPDPRPAMLDELRHTVEMPFELTMHRRGGQRLPLQVLAREVTFEGQQVRLMAMWDISGKKAAEESAARTEYLREQFLGLVGHDLHAPLSTIQHGVSALQREGGLVGEQAKHLAYMSSASRRMERTLREMLDFTQARISGRLSVTPAAMSLASVADCVLAEHRMSQPERIVEISVEGDIKGHWDEMRLVQMLGNLLQNALHHSPKHVPVELKIKGASDGVHMSVDYQSPPMPHEDRELVFEPFLRGKKAGGGELGLGLYVARQIAQAHGGRLQLESSTSSGTRFTVWLPRRAAPR